MIIVLYFVLFCLAAFTLYELRTDSAIRTPLAEAILLTLSLLGGIVAAAFLTSTETRDPITVTLTWGLLLLSIPLAYGRLRILLNAVQLERYGETAELAIGRHLVYIYTVKGNTSE